MIAFANRIWLRFSVVRFFYASSVTTVVDYTFYILLAQAMRPEFANVGSFCVSISVNFLLQRFVVFKNIRRTVLPSFVISLGLSVIGLFLTTSIIFLIRLGYPEGVLIPKLAATGLVFFWNYYSKKHLAFRDGAPKSETLVS